jgi:integrase
VGTITNRKGRYTAQIRIRRGGKIVHTEAKTFERRPQAVAWLKRRETELAEPGALERGPDPILADVVQRYLDNSTKRMGRSKIACLNMIKEHPIGQERCSRINTAAISAFGLEMKHSPSTVSTYLSHLAAVMSVAKSLWGVPLDVKAMEDARTALAHMGKVGRSQRRDRRPSLDELDRILTYFGQARPRRGTADMQRVIAFAIFSTRRQDEICRLRWGDLDEGRSRVLVRDMKDPGGSAGNDVWCELPPEALMIISGMPRIGDCIFPWQTDTVCAAFTRAVRILGIPDLRFHDLRHEGVSRLFEMGKNIPQVALVSAHRNWSSLQRYAHLRQTGDKYAGWKWLPIFVNGDGAALVDPGCQVSQVDAAGGLL